MKFSKDQRGQTTTEYILLVAVVAMIVFKFKTDTNQKLHLSDVELLKYHVVTESCLEKMKNKDQRCSLGEPVKIVKSNRKKEFFTVKKIKFNPKRDGEIELMVDIGKKELFKDQAYIPSRYKHLINSLKKEDKLRVRYPASSKEYLFSGLYINGTTLEDTYKERGFDSIESGKGTEDLPFDIKTDVGF